MAGSALFAVQKAIYRELTSNQELMAIVTGIFDQVPQDQPFPYVTIGEFTSVPFRTHSRFGEEITVTMHIWSQAEGYMESATILDQLNKSLADVAVAVEGFGEVGFFYEFSQALREPDGVTRQMPFRYRLKFLHLGGD